MNSARWLRFLNPFESNFFRGLSRNNPSNNWHGPEIKPASIWVCTPLISKPPGFLYLSIRNRRPSLWSNNFFNTNLRLTYQITVYVVLRGSQSFYFGCLSFYLQFTERLNLSISENHCRANLFYSFAQMKSPQKKRRKKKSSKRIVFINTFSWIQRRKGRKKLLPDSYRKKNKTPKSLKFFHVVSLAFFVAEQAVDGKDNNNPNKKVVRSTSLHRHMSDETNKKRRKRWKKNSSETHVAQYWVRNGRKEGKFN